MNNLSIQQKSFPPTKRQFLGALCCLLIVVLPVFFCSCKGKTDYFSYVSELRNNVFIGENETLSVRAYALEKESPYVTDGIPCEKNVRTEVYVVAPSADKTCEIAFTVNNENICGEMSYDNVKGEYFFAHPVSTASLSSLVFTFTYGDESISITAISVCSKETLTPQTVLSLLVEKETELFSAMTDKYGFTGEIYMRLIYEDAPFYYVGIIDRNGNVTAFLLNANTGKILAKRQP